MTYLQYNRQQELLTKCNCCLFVGINCQEKGIKNTLVLPFNDTKYCDINCEILKTILLVSHFANELKGWRYCMSH